MNKNGHSTYGRPKLQLLRKRFKHSRGQTLVEYALILGFICLVAIGVLVSLTKQVNTLYSNIGSAISSVQASH